MMPGRRLTVVRRRAYLRVPHLARALDLNWHASVIANLGHDVTEVVIVIGSTIRLEAWCDVLVDLIGLGACAYCVSVGTARVSHTSVETVQGACR